MRLRPIVGAILTCASQNIPLRGHRDDAHHLEDEKSNPGNFIEILKYGASCGNLTDVLFGSVPSNQTYRSKTIQNELIEICGDMVMEELVDDVKKAKFFSLLADEATDCSNTEQMAVVLRFIDESLKIREDFLGFILCSDGLSGEALSENISKFITSIGLRMEECRGQGYDGAGNMAGKLSGVAARIQCRFEKAIYVHCGSHVLNLCVASSCSLPIIRDMMDNVRSVSDFFNSSPKRTLVLQERIKELFPDERHQKLINVCKTRWVARIDGLQIFIQCYSAVTDSLDLIAKDKSYNQDVRYRASGMKIAIEKFSFIVALVVVESCLKCTKPLTLQLQNASLDAGKAREKVSLLLLTIDQLRVEIDDTHSKFYKVSVNLGKEANITPSKPRTSGRQVYRENVPSESASDYFKKVVTIPFLDQLLGQIQSRFSEGNLDALDALYVMPNVVVSQSDWIEHFSRFLEKYKDDLPDPDFLECELKMWTIHCTNAMETTPLSLQDLLPQIDPYTFPNILTALKIFCTIPVTTCTCERSISTLRRLKTYLRSTMGEKRLRSLALLNVHRVINLDIEEIIERFARKHPRRMLLTDLLHADRKKMEHD
jgi:hypothetical protein